MFQSILYGRRAFRSIRCIRVLPLVLGGSPYPTDRKKMSDLLHQVYIMPKPRHVDDTPLDHGSIHPFIHLFIF